MGEFTPRHYTPKPGLGEANCRKCGDVFKITDLSLDEVCPDCNGPILGDETPGIDKDYIRSRMNSLTVEQWKALRNRSEDQLRKSPQVLKKVVMLLISEELIRYEDIFKLEEA